MVRNQCVVITGATRGLGRALAVEYAGFGQPLVLVARDQATLDELAGELTATHGVSVTTIATDLARSADVQRVVDELAALNHPIGCVFNNAALGLSGPFEDADLAEITALLDLNINGLTQLTSLLIPVLRRQSSPSRIVNVASLAGLAPVPNVALYAASKAYVVSFTRALHSELRHTDVSISLVLPGPIKTGMLADMRRGRRQVSIFEGGKTPEATARWIYKSVERGRFLIVPGLFYWLGYVSMQVLPDFFTGRISAWIMGPAGGRAG